MPTRIEPAQLDRLFFALSDATRRDMLARLGSGPASVSELAEPLGIALPSAVKHLAVLEQGGFVASRKSGRVRTYQADPAALDAMQAWVERHKAMLHAQFDRLDAYLKTREEKTRP
ncbi:MAG: winged helix-turn-helix transcriptional regulator [Comamonadaceae bacterium]|jgi:DNA-binding transcriptional ArsR family regulator|uniref:ArsR family transcriptional regulator n=1 Tax=Hydrogenophaga borbori TaxID=2294117 RepID=A0A372EQF3_9BURK|nr:metalloregulator ArsR/SmtB family transcription factor [Hydrogenophaga sp. SNF1]NCT96132.1 winged helix-turn-helix transcriptional regulator [Comamonadaceae bacterium]RFP82815.1 ArsR family transcriptional regulator [Hydrogenophaga borbori]WQB81623.1 metalloregulator ArsR/SmtB family transcription factor [Hydrogenophaga sp. SNF1]